MKLARLALLGTMGVAWIAPAADARGAQDDHAALHASIPDAGLVREVRRATRAFVDDPESAEAAGYAPFLGCVSGGGEAGAMGLHYVNFGLVGDGKLDPAQPEALVYEKRNGRLRLVAVEYIVDVDAWHKHDQLPPALMGQVFTYNSSPNRYGIPAPFYALHVWAWRENPHGTFVDWNPVVSCEGFTQNPPPPPPEN
jgi:hypothetical protein